MLLEIELVPRTAWASNVRSMITSYQWDKLRKATYQKAGYKCEICGQKGRNHPVEAHEVWSYDDKKKIQKLERIEALCPSCHEVKHIGRATANGNEGRAIFHYSKVNGLNHHDAMESTRQAFKKYTERSRHQWQIDLSLLDQMGIPYRADQKRQPMKVKS